MEHYRSEIEEIGYRFGIFDGKIMDCYEISCDTCGFGKPKCVSSKIEWLMSEYKPELVLTAREKGFLEVIGGGWIARDSDRTLYWSDMEPRRDAKGKDYWFDYESNFSTIDKDCFPFITWEDEEPWAVEDLRKLKVQE